MFTLMRRAYRYLVALIGGALDAAADPRIQIEQAIEESKRQQRALTEQAAAVIGNRKELELKLERAVAEIEHLREAAARALGHVDAARARGEEGAAAGHERTAQAIASRIAASEALLGDLRDLYERSSLAAEGARRAVEQNALALQRQLAEQTRLMTQLEAAKMQERMSAALQSVSALAPATDTPTFPEIRAKVEARLARGAARLELQKDSVDSRLAQLDADLTDARGAEILAEIRRGNAPARRDS
ncbi:MAG TPA: PspA/IM30 family protein [Candidatus Dormibacteraeota bacterium]|nr:PspA/IM30 family protein [Candidatus Dormibacteraeota bacterium]